MKIERTRNASRNIIFGIILKIYQIILPFVMRTVMIYFMGVEYLGLNSLFTSILQVLNLAELGVGVAMVYSMYKPIVDDDSVKICALMNLYKKYYRIIGIIVAVGGIVILPIIPLLIKSDLPDDVNIYVLYVINLSATVFSYWLFAYKNCLLSAHQRIDVTSKISLVTSTLLYISQLIIIIFFKNYYIFSISIVVTQIINNIVTSIIVTKMYPDYHAKGNLSQKDRKEINHRIRDLFTAKLGAVIVNSVDTVVISAFLGLTVLAVYQNYYYILTAVIGMIAIVFSSCTAGIGNSIIVETKEKNYNDLKKFTFLISWIATFCGTCFLCLFQPFMKIWVGENLMLELPAVICFSVYFFVFEINSLLNLYKDAAGMWHEDRFRPLVTALVNLALNLIMVNFLGIYGIILSTVISTLFVGMPWLLHNLFSVLFDKNNMKSYIFELIEYFSLFIIIAGITYIVSNTFIVGDILTLILRLGLCIIIPNVLYCMVFRRKTEFADSVLLLDTISKGKLKLRKLFKV